MPLLGLAEGPSRVCAFLNRLRILWLEYFEEFAIGTSGVVTGHALSEAAQQRGDIERPSFDFKRYVLEPVVAFDLQRHRVSPFKAIDDFLKEG